MEDRIEMVWHLPRKHLIGAEGVILTVIGCCLRALGIVLNEQHNCRSTGYHIYFQSVHMALV